MAHIWDIAVVGGGAAGLAAAIFCARQSGGQRLILLEKAPRVGRKLLATGGGTCNLTNHEASPSHYHGTGAAAFTAPALAAFSPDDCLRFFASIGVLCAPREEGREYPLCQQAGAVLDCLRLELSALGVTERCGAEVTALAPKAGGFALTLADGETLMARNVILSTGGAASPSLGGSMDAYSLAMALGHHRRPLFPALVQVRTEGQYVRAMKGLRTDATVSFCRDGRRLCRHTGELLFTEYGLSGPAVMSISRVVGEWETHRRGAMTAVLDLLPSVPEETLRRLLAQRTKTPRTGADFLTGILHKRIGQTVCRAAGFQLDALLSALSPREEERLVRGIKQFTLPVLGTQGFKSAQVTAGGMDTEEVDPVTMMSRRVPGLYLIGELLDVDGDCGGYNLHWAWASAHAAAKAVTAS